MEGTAQSAAVLLLLLISQGRSYCVYKMDLLLLYGEKQKKKSGLLQFQNKTHYKVEKLT